VDSEVTAVDVVGLFVVVGVVDEAVVVVCAVVLSDVVGTAVEVTGVVSVLTTVVVGIAVVEDAVVSDVVT
ncbi:hypothetical protein M9458_001293, partial [Cirrhinus mrigala]